MTKEKLSAAKKQLNTMTYESDSLFDSELEQSKIDISEHDIEEQHMVDRSHSKQLNTEKVSPKQLNIEKVTPKQLNIEKVSPKQLKIENVSPKQLKSENVSPKSRKQSTNLFKSRLTKIKKRKARLFQDTVVGQRGVRQDENSMFTNINRLMMKTENLSNKSTSYKTFHNIPNKNLTASPDSSFSTLSAGGKQWKMLTNQNAEDPKANKITKMLSENDTTRKSDTDLKSHQSTERKDKIFKRISTETQFLPENILPSISHSGVMKSINNEIFIESDNAKVKVHLGKYSKEVIESSNLSKVESGKNSNEKKGKGVPDNNCKEDKIKIEPGSHSKEAGDKIKSDKHSKEFAYKMTVKKQSEKRKLDAFACKQCEQYFDTIELSETERQNRMKSCRHRFKFCPPTSPEHYWDIDFPDDDELQLRGNIKTGKPTPSKKRKKPLKLPSNH